MNKYFAVLIILCFCFPGCIKGPRLNIPTDTDTIGNGKIINAVKGKLKDGKSDKHEKGATTGQSWWFFILGGVLIILGVVAIACKDMMVAGACVGGAFVMVAMPSFIEAIHAALLGFVWFFYGALILGFACLVFLAVFKVYHYVPKKKEKEILNANAGNKEVDTDDSGKT